MCDDFDVVTSVDQGMVVFMGLDKSTKKLTPIVDANGHHTARWKNVSDRSPESERALLEASQLDSFSVLLDVTAEEPELAIRPESLVGLIGVSQETLEEYGLGDLNPRQVEILADAGLSIDEALTVAEKPVRRFDQKETTAIIKSTLKDAFPDTKFSVKGSRGTGYGYLDVYWKGGPTTKQVEQEAGQFQSSYFEGMDDSTRQIDTTVVKIDGEWTPARFTDKGVSVHRIADFDEAAAIEETLGEPNLTVSMNGFYQHCSSCGSTLEDGGAAYYNSEFDARGVGHCSKACHAVGLEAAGATAADFGGQSRPPAEKSSFTSMAQVKKHAQPGTRITSDPTFRYGSGHRAADKGWSGTIEKINSSAIWVDIDKDPNETPNPMRRRRLRRIDWPAGHEVEFVGGPNTIQMSGSMGVTSFTFE